MKLYPREKWALLTLVLMFIGLASLYNLVSTPFEAPDEIGHYYYVRHLLLERQLPVIPDPVSFPQYAQEGTQGPFYYASAALFAQTLQRPLALTFEANAEPFIFNPHSICGQFNARYNVAALAHDPQAEAFPYAGRVRVLHVLRLWSTLLAAGTVVAIFVGTRLLFPEHPLAAWFATLLTAGMPEFLFMAGSVNNDNMITLLSTWSLVLMLQLLRTGLRWWQPLALGLLSGLAALTKASGLLLLPLACLSIGVAYWQSHTPKQVQLMKTLKSLAPHWGSAIAIFMLVAGWWFARNWQLYGDPSGTLGHLAVMPVRDTMTLSIFFQELPGLFLSWWGVFGCTMPPSYFYLIAGALTLGGLLGSLLGREELKSQRIPLFVLLIWFGLMWAAYLQWNWVIHAAKGRLLYPTLLAWNGLLGWGWAYWANRQHWVKTVLPGGLLLCAILIPLGVMAPRVTPPPIITQDVKLVISHPIEGSFGDAIALRGYALNQTSFEPGQQLDLALYWEAKGQPDQHYSLAIQLVSAIPGETSALLNFNTWPGGGNYPTGYWKTGEIIEDRYQLRLPDTVAQAQAWILQIIIYETESGARLPWNLQGQSIENHAKLSLVRVGASHQMTPPTDSVAAPVIFQNAIRLNAIAIKPIADQLRVELWWESLAPLPTDYTVFVHLLDAAGNPLTQADGPPLAGGFPTSFWHPGDTVHDVYILQQPDTGTSQTLKLGWYDPQNGTRLEAVQNGEILPEAALTLTVPATP